MTATKTRSTGDDETDLCNEDETWISEMQMTAVVFGLSLVGAFLISGVAAAQGDGRIYYGSRAGMHLTTVSKEGIGTANATIIVKHTPEDAKAFCVNYAQDHSMACVKRTLASVKVADSVTGNCVTKIWIDMYGDKFSFLGKAQRSQSLMADYLIKNIKTGEILDGSSASGYGKQVAIFQELCPGLAR